MIQGSTRQNSEGYTLIEVVIVLMIATVAFVAIYALFVKSMKYDTEGRYEIIAAELAQEGVEMIKNKKEKNEMDWAIWGGPNSGVDNPDTELTTFKDIDSLTSCNPGLTWNSDGSGYQFSCDSINTKIQYNKVAKKYVKAAGCAGSCVGVELDRRCSTEKIDADNAGENNALRATCIVSWKSPLLGGNNREVKTTLILTDWER